MAEEHRIYGKGALIDDKKVKDKINKARVELKRTANITNNILTRQGNQGIVKLRIGPSIFNEHSSEPGGPFYCFVDVLNKPQPCSITVTNYSGDLLIYASTTNSEPSEIDNQGFQ